MLSAVSSLLASLSLALKQPLAGYCDVETTHGDALVTKQGDYCTFIRIGGMKRMATRDDITRLANALRLDLSGALESKGHAIVGWYLSDPDMAAREIERINMDSCRRVGREVGLDLSDILDERLRLWSETMRWETSCFILWTRRAVLTKEELKQMKEEKAAAAKEVPRIGDAQRFFLRSELMAAHHTGFVNRVMAALRGAEVAATELSARDALVLAREALYRETAGSQWKPTLIGDKVMPRLPEDHVRHPSKEGLLWPSLRSQIFRIDAVTHGGQRVEIGENEYASVDMMIGPEDPRPFVELASWLGQDRLPWRCSFILEGGGKTGMAFKEIGSSFLSIFPANRDLQRAFASLRNLREQENHISVKLRASFATWAPLGETRKLRRRASTLAQRIEGWGNCKTARVAGDPLDGVMSSVPGLALASTGNPSLAPIGEALPLLPWSHTISPWERGSVLFRLPNGAIWPYDPSGGSMRPLVIDIFVAPPGSGKSVLANTINIGLCLSSAVLGSAKAKLPLIGKLDIGSSAEGFVRLIQEAVGPERRHEAIYTTMQFAPGYEFNAFDLQVGCEYPLPLEKAFLQNFLALLTLPPEETQPFEGMAQMISLVIDEAYRRCTEVPDGAPKRYRKGVEPLVDGGDRQIPHQARGRGRDLAGCRHCALRSRGVPSGRDRAAVRRAGARGPDRGVPLRTGPGHVFAAQDPDDGGNRLGRVRALYLRCDPQISDAEPANEARFRVGADHRPQPSGSRPDRLGGVQSPDRDDVSARAAHSGAQLLLAAGLRASRPRSGPALSRQAVPGGLRDGQTARL